MKKKEKKDKAEEEKKDQKDKKNTFKILSIGVAATLILSCAGAAVYFYGQYKKAVKNAQISVQDENKKIIETIGKFMELPSEEPKVATITDTEKLKDQAFFASAKNGDKVLIYSGSKKAILYRPESGKVIEVTSLLAKSVETEQKQEESSESSGSENQNEGKSSEEEDFKNEEGSNEGAEEVQEEAPQKELRVVVYNGTKTKGLASEIADKISQISDLKVVEKSNAKGIYEKNLVIDLTGGNDEKMEEIASLIEAEKGEMPETEKRPEADILIIGGK